MRRDSNPRPRDKSYRRNRASSQTQDRRHEAGNIIGDEDVKWFVTRCLARGAMPAPITEILAFMLGSQQLLP